MFKANNIKTTKRRQWRRHFTPCSNVSVVNFEQVNASWDHPENVYLFKANKKKIEKGVEHAQS